MKDREVKIKREIEELFFKPIILSIENIDKFEQREMKIIRLFKNTWHDWLINYILKHIRKSVSGFKNNVISLFKINTPKKQCMGEKKDWAN